MHSLRRRLPAAGVLVLLLLLLPPAAASAATTTPRLGAHTMIGPTMDPGTVDTLFRASHDAHLGIVRVDVLAAALFSDGPDTPDWHSLDVIRAAARHNHLQVMALLSGVPLWAARCPPAPVSFYRCPPADDAQWGRLVEQIAAHAPEVRYWEILNEANLVNPGTGLGEYFYGDAVAYASFLRVTSAAIKRGNPAAKVVFTGVLQPYDAWLATVLAQPGTVRAFDIANAHFRGGIGKLDDMVRAARRAFRRGGFRGPLWVSEMGYPSDQFYQWDPHYTGINPPTAQHEQARYLHGAIDTLLRSGAQSVFVTLRDLDGPWGIFGSEGILNWPAPTTKQAYYTVKGIAQGILNRAAARARAPGGSARARARRRRARARRRDRSRRASSPASR
jgi:hypothetical protein